MKNFDLTFTIQELNTIIKSLANKKSSSFEKISNRMVKLILVECYQISINQYSKLFTSARWQTQLKCSRLLCFNKVKRRVPRTAQSKPINLLPIFSKIYEKLVLLRFNQWFNETNILSH